MTVQHVDGEIVGREVHGLEHLVERHHLPAHLADPHLAVSLEALLDEPQEMFLVHTGGSVDVSVDLHNVSQSVSHVLTLQGTSRMIKPF